MSEDSYLKNTEESPKAITWPILIVFGVALLIVGLLLSFFLIPKAQSTFDATDSNISEAEMISSAGTEVRAGHGTPSKEYGAEGDIYLNVSNGDVFLRTADEWNFEANLAALAHERLTDPQGETDDTTQPDAPASVGPIGPQGEPGEKGQDGEDGTQVSLGSEKPTDTCEQEDDIFINVKDMEFFTCVDSEWKAFTY